MKKRKLLSAFFSVCLVVAALSAVMCLNVFAADSDEARNELKGYIEYVTQADGYRYAATDSAGNLMDCAKIIANPNVSGQFIAVYHTYTSGVGRVNMATSTDLTTWTFVTSLAGSSGANATQPTIIAVGSGFMTAWEQEPNNYIKVSYYSSWVNLQSGTTARTKDLPRQQSTYAEGTPHFYSATSTSADIGFHYYANGTNDRQARGTLTGFSSTGAGTWTSSKQTTIDDSILYWMTQWGLPTNRNIGDRDYISYDNYEFLFIEGCGNNSNFGDWRTFLYDPQTGNADYCDIQTHQGCIAFANPTITRTTFNGHDTLIMTLFVPTENNPAAEKGTLIYYRYIDGTTPTPTPTPSSINLALNKTATANQYVSGETPAKAVDSSVTNNSKWCSTASGDKWLCVDLGATYNVSRWVVKHAGAGGESTTYNTKNFKLQRSTDGSTWYDVEAVTNNTASITDRTVTSFSARYVRLYITQAEQSANNAARIYEFEAYAP
jgi:hypothetical protein